MKSGGGGNYMELRVEGRRLVGRSRKTWLENVEVDMVELEIEDIYNRKKCRRNVMKRKSKPIRKRTISRKNNNENKNTFFFLSTLLIYYFFFFKYHNIY